MAIAGLRGALTALPWLCLLVAVDATVIPPASDGAGLQSAVEAAMQLATHLEGTKGEELKKVLKDLDVRVRQTLKAPGPRGGLRDRASYETDSTGFSGPQLGEGTSARDGFTPPPCQLCNWECYLENYEDLRKAFGKDQAKAQQHWYQHGFKEKRCCHCGCDTNLTPSICFEDPGTPPPPWNPCPEVKQNRVEKCFQNKRELRFGNENSWVEMDADGVTCNEDGSFQTRGKLKSTIEREEGKECQIRKCVNDQKGYDSGHPARCTTTKCGSTMGSLKCEVNRDRCILPHESYKDGNPLPDAIAGQWCSSKMGCSCTDERYFGKNYGIASCPDGKVTDSGVFVPGGEGLVRDACFAWSSKRVAVGELSCGKLKKNDQVCTKIGVTHGHSMARSAAVLVYKRTRCQGQTCHVYKSGRCIDVGEDVYSSTKNNHMLDTLTKTGDERKSCRDAPQGENVAKPEYCGKNLLQMNQVFARRAESLLRQGKKVECTEHDNEIASNVIIAF